MAVKSIIPGDREGRCYVCDTTEGVEVHHIFGAADRPISDREGLFIHLCRKHHEETHRDAKLMQTLHEVGQEQWERTHSREEFIKTFRQSYL